jgi:hypothetical protein
MSCRRVKPMFIPHRELKSNGCESFRKIGNHRELFLMLMFTETSIHRLM